MRATWIALYVFVPLTLCADSAKTPGSSLAHDPQMEERFTLLTAKVKKMAEIQDLMLQQQQLVMQHLDGLRDGLDGVMRDRSNSVSRVDFAGYLADIDGLKKQWQAAQATNRASMVDLINDVLASKSAPPAGNAIPPGLAAIPSAPAVTPALVVSTNNAAPAKLVAYRVQSGDTLLRIVARTNELLEKSRVPKITQEHIEKANPGLNADKIRVGQMLWLPVAPGP